jgi:hypothetical protein
MDKNGSSFDDWTENHAWFRTNYARLARRFDHQNVAVYGKKVVDHDSSLSRLLNRVGKSYPRDRVVVEYVTRRKRELIL